MNARVEIERLFAELEDPGGHLKAVDGFRKIIEVCEWIDAQTSWAATLLRAANLRLITTAVVREGVPLYVAWIVNNWPVPCLGQRKEWVPWSP